MIGHPSAAVEQVLRAKARYCRDLDTKQGDAFAQLPDDWRVKVLGPEGRMVAELASRDPFVRSARARLIGAWSTHQVHKDEIDAVTPGQVSAIWSTDDLILVQAPRPGEVARLHGYGRYHETWTLTDLGWRITVLEVRRTVLMIETAAGAERNGRSNQGRHYRRPPR